jgi:CRISPR/Cas system CSM-associated protein Csm3 (group 7 of RAMP superfamily)
VSEKNYGFINLDRPTKSDIKKRNTLQKIVVISYILKLKSPLHIGSGFVRKNDKGIVAKEIARDEHDTPIIPGSTLKGCIEANFRYIVKGACGTERCRPRNERDRICPLCNLFGAMNLGSRIHFKDAKLILLESQKQKGLTLKDMTEIIKIPQLTQAHNTQRYSVKYYHNIDFDNTNIGPIPIWITKPGAIFQGEIRIENPTQEELQMIVNTLFYRTNGLQIGMGKNLGMGILKTQLIKIKTYNPINLKIVEEVKISEKDLNTFIINPNLFNEDVIKEINASKGKPFTSGGI